MAKKISKWDGLADQVLQYVGGSDNITSFLHCITRLRFHVKDKSLIQDDKIKKIPGVIGTAWSNEQYQVIIGQSVGQVYDLIAEKGHLQKETSIDENLDAEKGKKFSFKTIVDAIVGCIIPLIPMFLGCGLIQVSVIILNLVGILSADSNTYTVLTFAGKAGMYFMPILIGWSASKKFKCDAGTAMALCAVLVAPELISAVSAGEQLTVFGLPIYNATYANMMFPSILVVFVMSYVEKFFKRIAPETFRVMFVPLMTMLVMIPLELCAVAPLGIIIGNVLSSIIQFIYSHAGFLAVGLLSGLYPLLILTGMHATLSTACMAYFMEFGYDPLILPACYMANFCQAAAAFAVTVKSKDKTVKGTSSSTGITAFVAGITEPALFGVNARYKTPLIASVIGGFAGGCYLGIMGVKDVAVGGLGFLAVFGFISADIPMNFWNMIIGTVIGMLVTFILTYILFKDETPEQKAAEEAVIA